MSGIALLGAAACQIHFYRCTSILTSPKGRKVQKRPFYRVFFVWCSGVRTWPPLAPTFSRPDSVTCLKQVLNQLHVLAMCRWLISPKTSRLANQLPSEGFLANCRLQFSPSRVKIQICSPTKQKLPIRGALVWCARKDLTWHKSTLDLFSQPLTGLKAANAHRASSFKSHEPIKKPR